MTNLMKYVDVCIGNEEDAAELIGKDNLVAGETYYCAP